MSMQDGASAPNGAGQTGDDGTNKGAENEAFARRMGWRPEDEWNGPEHKKPARFLSADEYVEKTMTEVPVLRERLRFFDNEVTKSAREIGELKGTITEQGTALKELLDRSRSAEQRGYDRAQQEIKAEMREAVKAADPARYEAAEQKLTELEKNPPKAAAEVVAPEKKVTPAAPAAPQVTEDAQRWIDANPWFRTDQRAATKAIALHGANIGAGMSEADSLADVRESMQALRPDLFENTRRAAPAVVGAPSGADRTAAKPKGKTVADLPADAKESLAKFKRLIPGFTDKDFLETYEW
jgi:hypothetical protein